METLLTIETADENKQATKGYCIESVEKTAGRY